MYHVLQMEYLTINFLLKLLLSLGNITEYWFTEIMCLRDHKFQCLS